MPNGKVPVWVTPDKEVLTHKDSIMRYLGRCVGKYSRDRNYAYEADWAIETVNDVIDEKFIQAWINDDPPTEEEIKMRVYQMTRLNHQLESKLMHRTKWVAGNSLSIGDFVIAACYHSFVLNDYVKHDSLKLAMYDTLQGFPHIKEWLKRISTELGPYLDKRPERPL